MLKYILIAVFGLCGFIGVGFAVSVVLDSGMGGGEDGDGGGTEVPFPVAETPETAPSVTVVNREEMNVRTRDNALLAVHDIRKDPGVSPLEVFVDEGKQYVFFRDSYAPEQLTYQLMFYEKTSEFMITLFAEPLTAVRTAAEAQFLNRLGISKEEACRLNVSVRVLDDLRPELMKTDIGLSFCSGAISL